MNVLLKKKNQQTFPIRHLQELPRYRFNMANLCRKRMCQGIMVQHRIMFGLNEAFNVFVIRFQFLTDLFARVSGSLGRTIN